MVSHRRTAGGEALKLALIAAALPWSAAAMAGPVDRWAAEIAQASARFAIPEGWIRRVIRAESGGEMLLQGRPIVSRAGAMGLMQLMPGTWREMRAWLDLGPDPHNPHDNILAGTAYLRLMYDRFGYPGLFAAYNAGPARYATYLSGAHPLPAETRAYVAAVARTTPRRSAMARRSPSAVFAVTVGGTPATAVVEQSAPPPHSSLFAILGSAPLR